MAVNEGPFFTYLEFDVPNAAENVIFAANVDGFLALFGASGTGAAAHPDFDKIDPATRDLIIAEMTALKAIANEVA